MKRLFLTFCLALSSTLLAEETATPEPSKPTVEKVGENRYKIGNISFDSAKGEISFPVEIEQKDVLIEYLITTQNGKLHETLFSCDISPFNLNVAMKLLGFLESKELLTVLDENDRPTEKFYEVTAEEKLHSRFSITASWTLDGKAVEHNVTQLLVSTATEKPMPSAPWIYSGSYMLNGKFKPELSGDIIAIFTDRTTIANYAGEGRENDELWLPNRALLPPFGTPITLTFKKTNPTQLKQ